MTIAAGTQGNADHIAVRSISSSVLFFVLGKQRLQAVEDGVGGVEGGFVAEVSRGVFVPQEHELGGEVPVRLVEAEQDGKPWEQGQNAGVVALFRRRCAEGFADLPQPFAGEEGKPLSSADLLRVAVKDWKGMSFPTKRGDGRRGDESEVYGEDILLGYRWFDFFKTSTQFPFGYGLSYTTFSYGKPRIADRTVSIEVTNTGHVVGKETVQFYVGDDKSSVVRPVKELKHFEKILLKPGETRTVTYTIQPEDLCFFDESKHAWVSEPGSFTIFVGASSSDIKCKLPFTLRP